MNAPEVLAELARVGVELACRDGRRCARPSLRSRPAIMALVREHAAELRRVLDSGAPQRAHELDDAHREAFEERAAIMEYDGEMTRAEAERLAADASAWPCREGVSKVRSVVPGDRRTQHRYAKT